MKGPIFFSILSGAYGWGGDGHRIITSLAKNLMTSRNADSLLEPLGDLMKASTWADTDEAEEQYPLSSAYHFSNTPYRDCSAFDITRDCGFGRTKGICIVTGLSEAITLATDPHTAESVRTDSLKFILHLMADIHQPLHTGFREDSGGLRIILGQPKGVDLHAIWDTTMVDQLKNSSGSVDVVSRLQKRLEANNGAFLHKIRTQTNLTRVLESQADITDFVAGIATDTATTVTCRSAYTGLDNHWVGVGDAITSEYLSSRIGPVTVQILKASVRLGVLLDTIADTLYMRKRFLKDARRSERIAKLFERQSVDFGGSGRQLGSNRFSALFIDFDSILTDEVTSGFSARPVGRAPEKKTCDDDDAVFEEYVKTVARERASYTFYGVDLSEIAHVRNDGIGLISSRSELRDGDKTPVHVWHHPIDFINKAGEKTTQSFAFDREIFREKMNDELIIRTVLAASKIDPRIDLTDYLAIYKPHRSAPCDEQSPIWRALFHAHSHRDTISTSFASRIKGLRGKIVGCRITELKIHVFLHAETLLARDKFHTRINRFRIIYNEGTGLPRSVVTVFYDPAIIDGPLMTNDAEFYSLLYDSAHPILSSQIDKIFFSEISEVELALRRRSRGESVSDHIAGKHVEWFFDYHGDKNSTYWVVEWFRKGASDREMLDFLALKQDPIRVYADDYQIVPRGFSGFEFERIRNMSELSYAMALRNSYNWDYQVQIALHRIESNRQYIMAFQVGQLKAFFHNHTVGTAGYKFSLKTIHDDREVYPTTYVLDTRILYNLTVPLSMMDPIILKLESFAEGNWQTSHPSRSNLVAQLAAIEYLTTSNDSDHVKLVSPRSAALRAIGDFKPTGSEYSILVWG